MHVTLFDRAAPKLRLRSTRALEIGDAEVVEAADWLLLGH